MGSIVSIKKPRLKKLEYEKLLNSIDRDEFLEIISNNSNDYACKYFDIGLGALSRIKKDLNIVLTPEQIKIKNKKASEQKVFEKYGVKNNFQRNEVQDKIKQKNFEKYGVENQFARDEIKEKIKVTTLLHYGVEYIAQSEYYQKNKQTKYYYENETFDSFPELAVWIFAKDHNIKITRCPVKLNYKFDNKDHYYTPDFLYDGKLVEIKGIHFFKNNDINSVMINPFDETQNALAEAKHQCMIKNNVEIWTEDKYMFAIMYCQSIAFDQTIYIKKHASKELQEYLKNKDEA